MWHFGTASAVQHLGWELQEALRMPAQDLHLQEQKLQNTHLTAFWFAPADEALSFRELQEALRMPKEDLTRVLHSLACAKYKVLKKAPEGKSIGEDDSFSVNTGFTDKMRRIKVCFLLSCLLRAAS